MSSSKVGKATTEKTTTAEVPLNDAKGVASSSTAKKGRWGRMFRGKAYEERLSLEESLRLVVTKSESPPSGAPFVFL